MLNSLDEFVQWLALLQVYAEEIWILPLAVAVIIATKGRPWAAPLRRLLLVLLLIYVVAYEMDRYSLLAVPILVLAIASDAARDFWYRLFGGIWPAGVDARSDAVPEAGAANASHDLRQGAVGVLRAVPQFARRVFLAGLSRSRPRLRDIARLPSRRVSGLKPPAVRLPGEARLDADQQRQRLYGRVSWGVQLVAIVAAFIYFDAPLELWSVAAAAALLSFVASLIPGWRILAERRFQREVRRDPRLARYLSWVRWTRARRPEDRRSMLADNLVCMAQDRPEPGGIAFQLGRIMVRRRRLMTIESEFVCQNLLWVRGQTWRDYQNGLYGDAASTSLSEALDSKPAQTSRLRWLALTEALAECVAFSDGDEMPGERPQWLMASELLAHAGEVELEMAFDLELELRAAPPEVRSRSEAQRADHRTSAAHYFDLSARCVENHLEPGSGLSRAPLGQRWRRIVGDRANWSQPRSGLGAKDTEDELWASVLALRYQLLATLVPNWSGGVPPVRHVLGQFSHDFIAGLPAGVMSAALARDAAESSLWIARQQGDPGSRWVFDDRRVWADRLKQADYWRVRLMRGRLGGDLSDVLAETGIRRVLHLWGLAIEQDLAVLQPGADPWRDRLESAADLFVYEGSPRVRRLAALAGRHPGPAASGQSIVQLV